jgi:hypothetical protein
VGAEDHNSAPALYINSWYDISIGPNVAIFDAAGTLLHSFFAYALGELSEPIAKSQAEFYQRLEAWGFKVNPLAKHVHGVKAALAGASQAQLHESWRAERTRQGWVYGPVLDRAAKVHNNLVPYDQLPDAQRTKDALFKAVVDALR